jgi:hypothetical protein
MSSKKYIGYLETDIADILNVHKGAPFGRGFASHSKLTSKGRPFIMRRLVGSFSKRAVVNRKREVILPVTF